MRTTSYDIPGAAAAVADQARFVRVDEEAVRRWAAAVNPAAIQPAHRPSELSFGGSPAEVARWVLLLDCLNFCFWTHSSTAPSRSRLRSSTAPSRSRLRSRTPWAVDYAGRRWQRYPALVASLHRGIHQDRRWLDPRRWAEATQRDVEELFRGHGCIPMLDERVHVLNETGRVTLERFGGEALHLVESAGYESSAIVAALAEHFGSFRDIHSYVAQPPSAKRTQRGAAAPREVPILKRAQIFVSDLAAGWRETGGPAIAHLERLTAFADYRVPQMLRHLRILTLNDELEARIEAGQLIEASSAEEIELRACSIHAVEIMRQAVQERSGEQLPAWRLDEYLWERSHDQDVALQHHRTLTWFY